MKQVLLGHRKDQDHDRQANTEVTQEVALRMQVQDVNLPKDASLMETCLQKGPVAYIDPQDTKLPLKNNQSSKQPQFTKKEGGP